MRYLPLLLALFIPATAQVAPKLAPQSAPMLNLVVIEGEGATNNIRQRTAREPIVQVQDENHKPVAGAIVVFTLPSNGAGGVFADGAKTLSMVSDSEGKAVAHGFRPNGLKGQFNIRVTASYRGQVANTSIAQTNGVAAAGAGAATAGAGVSTKLIVILAVVGAAAAGGIIAATHSGSTSTTPTPTPVTPSGVTIAAGAGTVGPPR